MKPYECAVLIQVIVQVIKYSSLGGWIELVRCEPV